MKLLTTDYPDTIEQYQFITFLDTGDGLLPYIIDNIIDNKVHAFDMKLCEANNIRVDAVLDFATHWWNNNNNQPFSAYMSNTFGSNVLLNLVRIHHTSVILQSVGPLTHYGFVKTVMKPKRKYTIKRKP